MSQVYNQKFNLDDNLNFSNDIKKIDYLKVALSPSSFANLNKAGNIIFQNQQSSNPLDICNSVLYYKFKIEDLAADENITLENNFFPRLFEQISLKLGTTEVENIQNPGDVSTMLNFVMTDDSYKKEYGTLDGWIPDVATGDIAATNTSYALRKAIYNKGFEGRFPLKKLFGFLQCYNRVIFLIPIELTLNRKINNDEVFYGAANTAAKITFEEMELWIPEIRLNPVLEVKMLQRLNTDKDINVSYLYRQAAKIDLPEGANYSWKPAFLSERPRYIFIAFKDPVAASNTNNNKFIQKVGTDQIKSIRIQLNSTYYPESPMVFDSTKNYQMQPYQSYVQICKVFGVEPQLNYPDFKDLYSIFCFDVSAQDEKLASNGCDVTIHINKDTAFKASCYCLILKESHSAINLKNGKMHMFS